MAPANELSALKVYLEAWPALLANGVKVHRVALARSAGEALSTAIRNGTAYRAIVIAGIPGAPGNRSNLRVSVSTKDLKCYGDSSLRAREVWGHCREALKALTRSEWDNVLLWSATITPPLETFEPDPLNWPLCYSTFDVMAAEITT